MKITDTSGPSSAKVFQTTNDSPSRTRAIEMLTKAMQPAQPASEQVAVANPSSVTPEEMQGLTAKPQEKVQNVNSEAPASAPIEEPKAVEDTLSSQYATLARREKALNAKRLQQEAAFKAREEAFAARERELAAKSQVDQSQYIPKERLTSDPLNTLQELGLSYDKLVEMAMNAPKPEEIEQRNYQKRIEAELKALREEQQQTKKSFEEQQTNSYKQALNQIKTEVSQLVSSDPSFEIVNATNSVQDVVDLIERTYKEDGVLLSVEEAAQSVEEYLESEALKISNLKKIQQKMRSAEKPADKKQTEAPAPQQQQLKTLTNANSTTRQLTARERAILAFKGEKF